MPMQTSRRVTAAILAAGALLLAAFAIAPTAGAATLYACVKKNGTAHIYAKKPKCKKHESKLSWNTEGAAGRNGSNGLNGLNGVGTNGTNGTNGKDLTSHTPLPSGESESGWFATGGGTSTSGEVGEGVSFNQPLATPITEEHAIFNDEGVTSTHCPGFGHADPGYLCLYTAERNSMAFVHTLNFVPYENNSTGKFGFALYFSVEASFGFVDGSWTVTAP
jgi:hypothetical protein